MKSYNVYLRKRAEKESLENQNKVHFYAEVSGSDYVQTSTEEVNTDDIINGRYQAFRERQEKQFEIFAYKDSKYGRGNIFGDDEITYSSEQQLDALRGLYFRMRDKLNRYKTLIEEEAVTGNEDSIESIYDTLDDLSNYCNIAIMVKNKKW